MARRKKPTKRHDRKVRIADLSPQYPWERQPREPPKAWTAFVIYRDDRDERSIKLVAYKLVQQASNVFKWSSKYNWVKRAEAFDRYEDVLNRKAARKSIDSMHERHARNAVIGMAAAMNELKKYVKTENNPEPQSMKVRDATRLFDVAARIERLARGEPDTIQEVKGEVHVATVDDKRASMIKLLNQPAALGHLRAISKMMGTDGSDSED